MGGVSGSPSVISCGSGQDPGWAVAGQPLYLHLIFRLLFWTPHFESVPNEAKINCLRRCHKYSTYWKGVNVQPFTAVFESCAVFYI